MDTVSTMANGHGISVVAISCGVRLSLRLMYAERATAVPVGRSRRRPESPEGRFGAVVLYSFHFALCDDAASNARLVRAVLALG